MVKHYILKCPLYSAPRNKLVKAIRDIIAPGVHHSILPHFDPLLFVNIVLKGSNDVKADENVNIFNTSVGALSDQTHQVYINFVISYRCCNVQCVMYIYIVWYCLFYVWESPSTSTRCYLGNSKLTK